MKARVRASGWEGERSPLWAPEQVTAPLWASVSSSGKWREMICGAGLIGVGDEVQGGEECAGALCSSSLRGEGTALVTVR